MGLIKASELVFVDAPPPKAKPGGAPGGNPNLAAIAERLRKNPGCWAMIGTNSVSLAKAIRDGDLEAYRPAGAFEAVYRSGDTWARYVGKETGRANE